ncbi:MAG: TIM44-like domain-containing protein [Pseudolabrys sp.]
MRSIRSVFALSAVAAALILIAGSLADARPGGGGSRGSRTFSAPPVTNTAPRTAAPLERTMTQPTRPGATAAQGAGAAAGGGMFSRPGLLGGLAAGFLGAGLFGLLAGQGLFGNMAGFASIIGLLLQVALVVIVARLLWAWWQRRQQGLAFAGPMQRNQQGGAPGGPAGPLSGLGLGGGTGAAAGAAAAAPADDVTIGKDDYDAFEQALGEIQTAYGREDLGTLRRLATPEMLSYFSEDLAANASRGVRNEISDVQLLQGDLAEAWSEGATQYATLAMRFSLNDRLVSRDNGQVVDGGPQEVTELWTFMRSRGGHWILSAIQAA